MTLNGDQIQAFLSHNDAANRAVATFNALVGALDWTQIPVDSAWDITSLFDLIGISSPIPPAGAYAEDKEFGTLYVIMYPDARGQLHFTAANSYGGAKFLGAGAVLPSPKLPALPSFNLVLGVLGLLAIAAMFIYGAPIVERLLPARAA